MFVGCLVEMAGQTDFPFSSFSGIGQSGTAPHLEQAVVEINTETGGVPAAWLSKTSQAPPSPAPPHAPKA
jgi:hypothetical protein